jgi:transposase InsO family protein
VKFPSIMRRPLHSVLHAKKPCQILHSDYFNMTKSGYLLVIVDVFRRKILLYPTESANSWTVVRALNRWKSTSGSDTNFAFMTDQGSHFCSELV